MCSTNFEDFNSVAVPPLALPARGHCINTPLAQQRVKLIELPYFQFNQVDYGSSTQSKVPGTEPQPISQESI